MSLYAIKDEDGELRDTAWDSPNITREFYAYTGVSVDDATREAAKHRDSRVVELVEKAEPVEVPQWFDEWLDAFSKADPKMGPILAAGRIAQEGMNMTADEPFLDNSVIDPTDTPRLTQEQSNYLYYHKQELMLAVLAGNYTVKQPKRWYVRAPKEWDGRRGERQRFYKHDNDSLDLVVESIANNTADEQFTAEEIEKYHLDSFETVEVED